MRLPRLVASLIAFLIAASAFLAPQTSTSSLRGTVSDAGGAVLTKADVTLSNPATAFSHSQKTAGDGSYQFAQVPPGEYKLSVSAPGFATVQQKVQLEVAVPATVNITMKVQGAAETLEVSGQAALVNTQDATIGNVFSAQQILNLPAEGRDPIGILSLQPGVAYVGNQTTEQQDADSRGGAVNGARSDQTNVILDGVDNNDQTKGYAFQGALRSTLDSVQEFRVTTTSANADAGRSSGAQVSLVTKSGTNSFHGSLYEYHRPTFTTANDWFNKKAQLSQGLPNRPGKLIRNTFGASVGGPIIKNRFFFFSNYEGRRTAETAQVIRAVPSETLRQGIIRYVCSASDTTNCTTSNPFVSSTPLGLVATLGPSQILAMDSHQNKGVNPVMLPILQSYPLPNTDVVGNDDGLNLRGFTFAAPTPGKQDTYITKLDYNLSQDGNHRLFLRGNLQNDRQSFDPQFPGRPPRLILRDNSKGLAAGYTAILGTDKVNNFRYGFIRQGTSRSGINPFARQELRFFDDPVSFDRTQIFTIPVHTFADDFSWTRGRHTIQFGGNWRFINNIRTSNLVSFSESVTNQFWLNTAGIAGKGTDLDPAVFGFPAVDPSVGAFAYDASMMALLGIVSERRSRFNIDRQGNTIPEGQPINRKFRNNEMEFYAQDSWRATPNLTLTGGLRYTLLQPPYETHGLQVAPSLSLHDFFNQRALHMQAGQPFTPQISFQFAGQANNGKPYWAWDYGNVAPRASFAYSPNFESGILKGIFGGAGKTSIRGGYGIYYDHFGEGVVDTFDVEGSFGLDTLLTNPAGFQGVDCAARITSYSSLPVGTFCGQNLSPPPPGFSPPPDLFAITWGLDDRLKTPYSHAFDLSISRDLGKGFVFETAYIGRLGRRLLQQKDLAMPLDLVDSKSGMDYFTAATQLVKLAEAGTPVQNVSTIPFWQNVFPLAAGQPAAGVTLAFPGQCSPGAYPASPPVGPGASATQAMYELYNCFLHNETTSLQVADLSCIPACAFGGTPFAFYDNQYSSLFSWTTQGTSSYHGAQFMLRRRQGSLQFDFNYTLAKSIDLGSDAERNGFLDPNVGIGTNPAFFPGQIINSWNPRQMRGPSDFDVRHNINADWTYQLPFGAGRIWQPHNSILENIVGGWLFAGVMRWTSGFPFSVEGGSGDFPTNFELTGQAVPNGRLPKTGTFTDSTINPNVFKDPVAAAAAFRFAYPGESGIRNNLRGPGYFGTDLSLAKSWKITESQALRFTWDVFNVTNSVRFDVGTLQTNNSTFNTASFGRFVSTLTKPRIMQFGLRYSF